jgi:transcriptional regulator with XRE-family HTH domain
MDQQQAQELGRVLRSQREGLGLSQRAISQVAGIQHSTLVRLEQGAFPSPRPETLAAVTAALGLNLADIYTLAGYPLPEELPSLTPYLRTKYRDLPDREIDQLTSEIQRVLRRHGIAPNNGPEAGEDEEDQ